MDKLDHYIDGQWVAPNTGNYIEGLEPATNKVIYQLADGDVGDIDNAVNAARRAFPAWAALSTEERANWIWRLADGIEARLAHLAECETRDNGKPISLSTHLEIPRAAANSKFFAKAITQFHSECYTQDQNALHYTLRQPTGVIAAISPWNLPLYLFTWKVIPALVAGNTVVAKPPELASLTAFEFAKICEDIGLPAGVLNIVHGRGATVGAALCDHQDIDALTFTGGTETGARIAGVLAPKFKKYSLELGGKNPSLVFADCDLEKAIATCVQSSFTNQGEICLCTSRIYVERSMYDTFVEHFTKHARGLVVGDPLSQDTQVGAMITHDHAEKVLSYFRLAREEGGEVISGGERVTMHGRCENGFFIQPTIITGLNTSCRTNQEEIFGPATVIMPFDSEQEAISLANQSNYGLAATVLTENLSRAHRVSSQLQAGMVWVNCWLVRDLRTPFGGMKQSGVGREGGYEALRFVTEPKSVCIKI